MLTDMIIFRAALAKNSDDQDAKFEQARREAEALRAAARIRTVRPSATQAVH